MTPERRAEINRRLGEYEWPGACVFKRMTFGTSIVSPRELTESERADFIQCQHKYISLHKDQDYTTDLNALVRLERKLPPMRKVEILWRGDRIAVNLWIPSQAHVEKDRIYGNEWFTTEAEARAEAIMQYLEHVDGESV